MKIFYVPLDERPCNYDIPQRIVATDESIELFVPPLSLLGKKKISADIDGLWDAVEEKVNKVDAVVLSMDTLLFGGLIPSRIHDLTQSRVDSYLKRLKNLKTINPKLKIYAFECIMRSPQYDSSDEEPDYYADHGFNLHRRAYLFDKKSRSGLNHEETNELKTISIPEEVIHDYEARRNFNLKYNLEVAKLVKDGIIDFLVIPQDDSSEYGYTAIAQQEVIQFLSENNLESKINIYPGADEVGTSLLARCLNDFKERKTKVYAFYSSVLGPAIIPLYEDRPMHENLKYHLDVTNSYLVTDPDEADFILAINSPGKIMEEAFNQDEKDISYTSFRNLAYFVKEIERFINKGHKVAICDSAFSNGGDLQLIKFLDERNLLNKVLAYAGWNTNSNTLGTVLGSSIFGFESDSKMTQEHLVARILEDAFFQSFARQELINHYLEEWNISYYDFKDKQDKVEMKIEELLKVSYNRLNLAQTLPLKDIKVVMPWKRMFEIGLNIEL